MKKVLMVLSTTFVLVGCGTEVKEDDLIDGVTEQQEEVEEVEEVQEQEDVEEDQD